MLKEKEHKSLYHLDGLINIPTNKINCPSLLSRTFRVGLPMCQMPSSVRHSAKRRRGAIQTRHPLSTGTRWRSVGEECDSARDLRGTRTPIVFSSARTVGAHTWERGYIEHESVVTPGTLLMWDALCQLQRVCNTYVSDFQYRTVWLYTSEKLLPRRSTVLNITKDVWYTCGLGASTCTLQHTVVHAMSTNFEIDIER